MRLTELMAGDPKYRPDPDQDPEITGMTADSRKVDHGYLFAAFKGFSRDGRSFIHDALKKGAAAILTEPDTPRPAGVTVPFIPADDPRYRYAKLAAKFYGRQPKTVAAVTGTNGKTSVTHFTKSMWDALGHGAGSIGTLGTHAKGIHIPELRTTPDPVSLHQTLADLADHDITHLAMEASSHGLHQYRLDGVRVSVAAFTNLSRDHLDYHGTEEAYFTAKSRLFKEILIPEGTAVINADIPRFAPLAEICKARGIKVISYGRDGKDIRLKTVRPAANGIFMEVEIGRRTYPVQLPLIGVFQVMNALAALGIVIAGGEPVETAMAVLETLTGVRGRMEVVGTVRGAGVIVDYAHTPDALITVLAAARPHCSGRLICVFGCGGDRDIGKRPLMAKAVRRLADIGILTDDNPRTEDPARIRADAKAAFPDVIEIADRRAAIRHAVGDLQQGDLLIIAGKGHETVQIIGTEAVHFDDAEEARAALKEGRNG